MLGEFWGQTVGLLLTVNITCINLCEVVQKSATSICNVKSLGYT